MNTDTKNEQDERSPATPCRKCGALLGWIEGCGEPATYDYEEARELTECFCTRSRDEAIEQVGESLVRLALRHYEAMSKEQQVITHKMSRLQQQLSHTIGSPPDSSSDNDCRRKVCGCKGESQ